MNILKKLPGIIGKDESKEHWENTRRNDILNIMAENVYGITPDNESYKMSFNEICLEKSNSFHKAITEAEMEAEHGKYAYKFVSYYPTVKNGTIIIFICNRKISLYNAYYENTGFWPVKDLIVKGYTCCAFFTEDVQPDNKRSFEGGIIRCFEKDTSSRENTSMGAIGAWSFAASRVLDYFIERQEGEMLVPAVAGHSRGGKASLWCGAQDERFAYIFSNCSGSTGAAISRGKQGEKVKDINENFPYWFCRNYHKYNENEDGMPFDQHMLLGLLAPRYLYISSASKDYWADPLAEFLGACEASKIYGVYGLTGMKNTDFSIKSHYCHEGNIGYHIREGMHDLTSHDWKLYVDYIEKKQLVGGGVV